MNSEDKKIIIRRKPGLKAVMEELKFLKSVKDLYLFFEKAAFLLPRLTGKVDRWTRVPPSLQIEPTNSCNVACVTCGRSTCSRTVGRMDLDLFKKIVDDAADCGVKRVLLFLMGEPLLHPAILDMIRYIKQKHLSFHMTTNGMLLTDTMIDGILGSGVTSADYVTISILGYSKETHEKMMRGIDHERVWANAHRLIARRKELNINGPVLETVYYSTSQNEHEFAPFKAYWEKKFDHVIDGGRAVEAFSNQGVNTTPRTRTCTLLWERMAVQWNGDVVLCGEDMEGTCKVGDLKTQTIQEVWLGKEMTAYKQLHRQGKFSEIPICQYCDW